MVEVFVTAGLRKLDLGLFELGVPVEVVAPAFGGVAETDGNPDGWCRVGTARRTTQPHRRFAGRTPALGPITAHAARDDVLPVLAAPLGNRNHMVERELGGGKHLVAVLARVVVAGVDIGPGEGNVIEAALDPDETEQPDDRGQLEADGHRPYLAVVDRDHLDLSLAPERDRLLPVNDLQRLVRRVQKERLLHTEPMMQDARRAVKDPTWINPKQH